MPEPGSPLFHIGAYLTPRASRNLHVEQSHLSSSYLIFIHIGVVTSCESQTPVFRESEQAYRFDEYHRGTVHTKTRKSHKPRAPTRLPDRNLQKTTIFLSASLSGTGPSYQYSSNDGASRSRRQEPRPPKLLRCRSPNAALCPW